MTEQKITPKGLILKEKEEQFRQQTTGLFQREGSEATYVSEVEPKGTFKYIGSKNNVDYYVES